MLDLRQRWRHWFFPPRGIKPLMMAGGLLLGALVFQFTLGSLGGFQHDAPTDVYREPWPDEVEPTSRATLEDAFAHALSFWNLRAVSSPHEADIVVRWTKEFGGNRLGLTDGSLVWVSLGDSDNACSVWQPYDEETVYRITVHELGHALGHAHTSEEGSALHPTLQVDYARNLASCPDWGVPS